MQEFIAILVAIMMTFPSFYKDTETHQEREARMTVIATSIARASDHATCDGRWSNDKECEPVWTGSKKDLGLLLVTTAFWESRMAQHIHEGNCTPGYRDKKGVYHRGECDEQVMKDIKGRVLKRWFRSRTIWQLQKHGDTAPEWDIMVGTSQKATDAAAWAAAKTLSRGYRSCGNHWGAISKYAGVRHCKWEKGRKRVAFFERLQGKYTDIEAKRVEAKDGGKKVASNP